MTYFYISLAVCLRYVCTHGSRYGRPTAFTVTVPYATTEWKLCDLITNRSAAVSATGAATWTAENEAGTMLLLALDTPCH